MSVEATEPGRTSETPESTGAGRPARVLLLYESTDSGRAALREAAELSEAGAELTVVTLAPQAKPLRIARGGGGGGTGPYNRAVREEAEEDLEQARGLLGAVADRTTLLVLVGNPRPRFIEWVCTGGFATVLLPHRRFVRGGSVYAKALRQGTPAQVRVVRQGSVSGLAADIGL